jgi:hypothetical protein
MPSDDLCVLRGDGLQRATHRTVPVTDFPDSVELMSLKAQAKSS